MMKAQPSSRMVLMATAYDTWLGEVRDALSSINMPMDDWQRLWPFDFEAKYKSGTEPNDAASKANQFWWYQQNKSMGRNCEKLPGCWLPRGHGSDCQPTYESGDYVKVEFDGENGMPGEWMWVIVQSRDHEKQVVYGILDSEPFTAAR